MACTCGQARHQTEIVAGGLVAQVAALDLPPHRCRVSCFLPSLVSIADTMADLSAECKSLAHSLHTAAQSLSRSPEQSSWTNIEASAQALANALRVKSGPGEFAIDAD